METLKFTYTDSVAGTQTEVFEKLSEIVKHIEDFGWYGDSEGVVLQGEAPVLEYVSREEGLIWENASDL